MLILAGITLAGLSGENGILRRAGEAVEETKKAQYTEIINTIIMEKQIENSQNPEEERAFIEIVAEAIREKNWVESAETCDDKENYEIDSKYKTKIIVETTDGYEIIVNIDNDQVEGEVVSIIKGKAGKWKVEFNANGGAGTIPANIERRKGFSIEMPTGEGLTKEGYKIVGWSENPNENPRQDKFYKVGEKYTPTKDIVLYAIWDEHTVQVTFDKNTGDSGEMTSINIPSSTEISLPENKFSKSGYVFKEWNTNPEGNGAGYANEANVNFTEDTTLYAIWKEDIIAKLTISDNKFTEGTKISLEGKASANGIQKVELKVENRVLYTENVNGNKNYSKTNLGLDNLNQTELQNLDFYDINTVLYVTSMTGQIESNTVNIKNYTIGNASALCKFSDIVNTVGALSGETIIQLKDINTNDTNKYFTSIGKASTSEEIESKYFGGTYDGKNHCIIHNVIREAERRYFYSSKRWDD